MSETPNKPPPSGQTMIATYIPPADGQIVACKTVDKDGSQPTFLEKLPAELRVPIYQDLGDKMTFRLCLDRSRNWTAVRDADENFPFVNLLRTSKRTRDLVSRECSFSAIVMVSKPPRVAATNSQQASAISVPLSLDNFPSVLKSVDNLVIQIDIDPFGNCSPIYALERLMEQLSWGERLTNLTLTMSLWARLSRTDWTGFSDMRVSWALSDLWNKITTKNRASAQLPEWLEEVWFKCR